MSDREPQRYLLHIVLFIITFATTTFAGIEWITGKWYWFLDGSISRNHFWQGALFAIPFLTILTVHEFGHYFTAQFYKVKVSLPYYLPLWLGWLSFIVGAALPSIGTMGAFIRIKSPLKTTRQIFDIGIAGPLAGFVVALGVIWYGFTHLPPKEYIFNIHPEYAKYGVDYDKYVYTHQYARMRDSLRFIEGVKQLREQGKLKPTDMVKFTPRSAEEYQLEQGVSLGSNLLFQLFTRYVAEDPQLVPNRHEMMHYPFLFAGYMALFFTALNLLPIGQLDGGHILYGLVGYRWHSVVSPILFVAFVFYAGLGSVKLNVQGDFMLLGWTVPIYIGIPLGVGFLYLLFNRMLEDNMDALLLSVAVFAGQYVLHSFWGLEGYPGWLVFAFVLGRFLGVYHPPAIYDEPLSTGRKVLGWFSLVVFILCFTPEPFVVG